MLELLQERVTLFCELAEVTSGQDGLQPPSIRYLFRADTPQAPRAEKLLLDSLAEGKGLSFKLTKNVICGQGHNYCKQVIRSLTLPKIKYENLFDPLD